MNNQLVRLITDYQTSVKTAVALMQRSGIRMPFSFTHWIETDIPQSGELDGGAHYFKHGAGCTVSFTTGEVDFDFGEQGEIGGFDLWRLVRFAGSRLADYYFDSKDEVKRCFEAAVTDGSLVYSGCDLYYVANTPRLLAVDVDCRLPGDMLPSRNQDRVLVLYAHYFLAADLMRKNYEKLTSKWSEAGQLSQGNEVKIGVYFSSWLGFLGVTCEGLKKLNMRLLLQGERPENFRELISKSDEIGRMMKKHSNALREFRNNVFHLREDPEVICRFFANGAERLPWARELHSAIARFLSEYHVLCEVHYMTHGRKSEMDLNRKRKRRKLSPS
ncbi:hypothetical protein NUH87_24460 [Pseudomonas batumici]|uniref:DUF6896 domain-containing protein n=1 Tax=Pseudomonas batumici TaxID=226910 RepID=UPI0030CF3D66